MTSQCHLHLMFLNHLKGLGNRETHNNQLEIMLSHPINFITIRDLLNSTRNNHHSSSLSRTLISKIHIFSMNNIQILHSKQKLLMSVRRKEER